MAWTDSRVFIATLEDALESTITYNIEGDTFKAALFDNTITPDATVASAAAAYGAGVWASGEVSDGTNWDTAGEPLTSTSSSFSGTVYTFDAANTPQGGASTTLGSVFGVLVYNDTIASPVGDQGISFNYLGGENQVTGGTFTIVWHTSGIFTISV